MQDVMTDFAIRPIAPTFGAELTGLRITQDIGDAALAAFRDALARYRVLVIAAPGLDPADHVGFSRRLGDLELHAESRFTHPAHPEIFRVGNATENGVPIAAFSTGVEQWHSDSSYRRVPSAASLFHGVMVPPEGGETWFADATAAYDELPAEMKARIEGLRAVHSYETLVSFGQRHNPGRIPMTDDQRRRFPPTSQPLVRIHPQTGEKSLFVCPGVISHIEGMARDEGRALIDALMVHITVERYVYRHQWRQGDLVVWDNHATLHTASLFDHTRYTRLMQRTTVAGTAPYT